jgi:hypothetical protein
VGYNLEHENLEVEFEGGRIFRYIGVPKTLFVELLRSESVGGFLNHEIKPRYPVVDLDQAEAA